MANETATTVVLGEYLEERVDQALDVLGKRNPDLNWTREQLIRLAVGHGLNHLVRQHTRKKTNLPGVLHNLSPELPGEKIIIEDVSRGGISFRMSKELDMKVNQVFHADFLLDNQHQTIISKTLIVTRVSGSRIGAEFCEPPDTYDRELLDYLMS